MPSPTRYPADVVHLARLQSPDTYYRIICLTFINRLDVPAHRALPCAKQAALAPRNEQQKTAIYNRAWYTHYNYENPKLKRIATWHTRLNQLP